jgi:hypothetical protein
LQKHDYLNKMSGTSARVLVYLSNSFNQIVAINGFVAHNGFGRTAKHVGNLKIHGFIPLVSDSKVNLWLLVISPTVYIGVRSLKAMVFKVAKSFSPITKPIHSFYSFPMISLAESIGSNSLKFAATK